MTRLRTFDEASMRSIEEVVRRVLGEPTRTPRQPRQGMRHGSMVYLGMTDGSGITARSGTTPGSGTVTLYEISSAGALTARQDEDANDITVTAYNLSTVAVGASTYVMLQQEMLSGDLFAVWEDC